MLERIGSCRTVIFDKTGTLTYGRPALTDILCAPHVDRRRVLRFAASLEQYSKHPLAGSVLEAARQEHIDLAPASEISEKPGEGLRGIWKVRRFRSPGGKAVLSRGGRPARTASEPRGLEWNAFSYWTPNTRRPCSFTMRRAERADAFVRHLAPHHQVAKVMLVSGDRETEVRYLAGEVGITEVLFGKSPEEKVAIVRAESRKRTDAVSGGRNQRCSGHAGGDGRSRLRPEQRHYRRGRGCRGAGCFAREGGRIDSHRAAHAEDRPSERGWRNRRSV